MKCSQCGNPLNPNQQFCSHCGAQFSHQPDPMQFNGQPVNQAPQEPVITQGGVRHQQPQQIQMNYQQPTNPQQAFFNQQPMYNQSQQQNMYIQNGMQQGMPQQGFMSATPPPNNNSFIPDYAQPQHKKTNKMSLILVCGVLLIVLIALIAFLVKPEPEVVFEENGTRTIMVYLIGSDLESIQGAATRDIEEMIASDFDEDNMNLLLYVGGTKKWYTDEFDESENAIFEIKNGKIVKKESFKKELMTNGKPLKEFINYVYSNYKTDLYDLILWDHGGGPIYGYGNDENSLSSASMSLDTLGDALEGTKLIKDRKLDFIGFDACLMGSIEVAYKLKDYANYLIASEELEPGAGWNYEFLGEITKDLKTQELGSLIINKFFSYYRNVGFTSNLTLSMIDLAKVEKVISELDVLFNKADGAINVDTFSDYSRKLTRKTVYGNTGRTKSVYDLVDLKDLVNSISDDYPTEVQNVSDALDSAVIYAKDNMSNTNGLSIYFPTNNKKNVDKILELYDSVKISTDYFNFLEKYASYITGNKYVDKNSYRGITPLYNEEEISVELPTDLVNNYEKADYIIFRKLGENNYIPVFKSSNVLLSGNRLIAAPNNQQLIVDTPSGGEPGWATMYEIKREDGYTYYNVVAIVEKYDEELEGVEDAEPFQLKNVNIIYKVKDGAEQGEIIDVQLMTESDTAAKTSLELDNWEKIQFFNAAYKLFDESGNYLDEWESYKEYYINVFDIAEGFELKFVGLDYDLSSIEIKNMDGTITSNQNYEYVYMFRVSDTQGEIHQLNLVEVN